MIRPAFGAPPRELALASNEIHVWRCVQDRPADNIRPFLHTLCGQERARSERFCLEQHRNRFIVRRGMLRVMLGRYLACHPRDVELYDSGNGKPAVFRPAGGPTIHFNLSHSAGVCLFAFARFAGLGVDIEKERGVSGLEQIVERFFPQQHEAGFRLLPERRKQESFFRIWTRTEAYLKATGAGISVLGAAGEYEPEKAEQSGWTVHSFIPADGFAAALAAPRTRVTLTWFAWPA